MDDEITIYTTIESKSQSTTRLILKTSNMYITAYTDGKILFAPKEKRLGAYGSRFTIINTEEVKKGKTLYLHLKPAENMKGRFDSPVYLSSQNDFLFTLLCGNIKTILLCFFILEVVLILGFFSFKQLANKNKNAKHCIYQTVTMLLLLLFLFSKSDLFWFAVGNSTVKYVNQYSSYMLLPVMLCTLNRKRNRYISLFQIAAFLYALLRLLSFAAFSVPLSRGIAFSHIILISSFALLIYFICIKKRKSNCDL